LSHGALIEVGEMKATWKAVLSALNPSPVFVAIAMFADELAMNGNGLDGDESAEIKEARLCHSRSNQH
jgi:hypothetical protein